MDTIELSLAQMGSMVAVGLFVVMMLAVEVGRRIGRHRYQTDKETFADSAPRRARSSRCSGC